MPRELLEVRGIGVMMVEVAATAVVECRPAGRLGRHVHDGEVAPFGIDPGHLAVRWVRDVPDAGQREIPGAQRLNYLPAFVEDLQETPVPGHRADDEVLLLIQPDRVGLAHDARHNRDPRTLGRAQFGPADVDGRADPPVQFRGAEEQVGLPQPPDALGQVEQGVGQPERGPDRAQVLSQAHGPAALAEQDGRAVGDQPRLGGDELLGA